MRAFGISVFYVSETENISLRKTMTKLQLKISRHDRRVGTKLSKQSWKSARNIKQKWRRFFLHNRNKKLWKNPKIVIRRRFKHITNLKEAFFHHLHPICVEINLHLKYEEILIFRIIWWWWHFLRLPCHIVMSPQCSWMMLDVNVCRDAITVAQQKPSMSTSDPRTFQHSNTDKRRKEDFILSDIWRQMCLSTHHPGERDNERRNKRHNTVD